MTCGPALARQSFALIPFPVCRPIARPRRHGLQASLTLGPIRNEKPLSTTTNATTFFPFESAPTLSAHFDALPRTSTPFVLVAVRADTPLPTFRFFAGRHGW